MPYTFYREYCSAGTNILILKYSKTPIYRASWGKGIRHGNSSGTVNRGTTYIGLHMKLVLGERIEAR